MSLFIKKNQYTVEKRGMETDAAVLPVPAGDATKIEWPLNRSVIRFFWWIIVIALATLAFRVAYLNIIKGAEYRAAAERNSLRQLVIPAPRGIIYDRFGTP